MNRGVIAGLFGGVAAVSALLASAGELRSQTVDAPESLLPPGFDDPPSAPAPSPTPRSSPPGQAGGSAVPALPPARRPEVDPFVPPPVQGNSPGAALPSLPPLPPGGDELALEDPLAIPVARFDVPPAAQRPLDAIGPLDSRSGGFPASAIGTPGARYISILLDRTSGRFVSRWGQILVRRALASRLATPSNMGGADWAAVRARLLLRMGEAQVARALVQEVDITNYSPALYNAAMSAYLATADLSGLCPIAAEGARLHEDDWQWAMSRAICGAFSGEQSSAFAQIDRAQRQGKADRVDLLLAEKAAGAAGRRNVRIEWDGVDELTDWRFGLSYATGIAPPDELMENPGRARTGWQALLPMVAPGDRVGPALLAAGMGVLSNAALVDLYAQADGSEDDVDAAVERDSTLLRRAYAARAVEDRMTALRALWQRAADGDPLARHGAFVLTAEAAARIPPLPALADDSSNLVAAMLSGGFDRNALRWGAVVESGTTGWAQLVLAAPERSSEVSESAIRSFLGNDDSENGRKGRFLIAGLAGLGRVDAAVAQELDGELGLRLASGNRWSQAIGKAAGRGDAALVALLAGVGMQGSSWAQMTPRHLFHIVRSLDRSGLSAEARMIAAEAVARG